MLEFEERSEIALDIGMISKDSSIMNKKNRIRLIITALIIILISGLIIYYIVDPFLPSGSIESTSIPVVDSADINLSDPEPENQIDVPEPDDQINDSETQTAEPDLETQMAGGPAVDPGVKSVILMIGDGMGAEHRQAAQYANVGFLEPLVMDNLPVRGELMTSSADKTITDSAASATAMATGFKTNNKVIGLDPNLNFIPTILEQAQVLGKSVGLITTTHLAHATPAGFGAHVDSRYNYEEIAEQLSAAGVDVLFGGGEDFFLPPDLVGCYPGPGVRKDGRNLISEMIERGYTYICDGAFLADLDPDSTPYLLGLFGDAGMIRPYQPTLAEMTAAAIEILKKDPDGFFLMVEGGQIDWAAHDNHTENVIANTLALDEAVAVAKEYVDGAGDSLLIVTADHETGGMSVGLLSSGKLNEDGPFEILGGGTFYVNWTTGGHTATNVPLTASGPLADQLAGVHDNTFIHDMILDAFCTSGENQSNLPERNNPCGEQ